MTGFWIRVNARLADDAAVRAFARTLFPSLPAWIAIEATCGLLVTLWGRVVDEQEDGDISARDDDAIEEWAKWRGEPGAFASEFRDRFTDVGHILEWSEYQGPLIARREKDRERKRVRKEAESLQKAAESSGHAEGHAENGEFPRAFPADFRKVSSRNGDGNVNENYNSTTTPAESLVALDAVLPAPSRAAFRAEIGVAKDGMHGKPLTDEQVDRAARDFLAQAKYGEDGMMLNPNMNHFRGFLRNAGKPTIRPLTITPRPSKQEASRDVLGDWLATKESSNG